VIIAVIGPKESGKSTIANMLVNEYGFGRHAFADPLKKMLMVGFGLSYEQVQGDQKETPTDKLCGRSPRHAMQTLGTEWGRQLVHPDIWLTAWINTMPEGNVVCEDLRFPNEHAAITGNFKGIVVSIKRPGCEYDTSHESEAHAELAWNYQILNDGDMFELKTKVRDLCHSLGLERLE
jgi:hypothetical protein